MRVGVTVPQYTDDPRLALRAARHAERAGLDGVFVFDHLWPLGAPQRPALHGPTLLGALAASTERVVLGPLVARVGLVPDAVLVNLLLTLHRALGDRLVAALGTGDRLSHEENRAFGVPVAPAAERLARMGACCDRLRQAGVTTWIGGRSEASRRTAAAHADAWNSWGVSASTLAEESVAARPAVPTWGGQVLVGGTPADAAAKLDRHGQRPGLVHGTPADLAEHFQALAGAGVTWAVCAPLDVTADPEGAVDVVAEAAALERS